MASKELDYQYYAHLAKRIREGDPDAFAELYENTHEAVYRYVYYFMKNQDPVEDIVQEVYIAVYRNLPNLKVDMVLLPWIKQIAYHECCDYIRRERGVYEKTTDFADGELVQILKAASETEDECFRPVYDREIYVRLHEALEDLPVKERQAFVLYYKDELRMEEVADFMDVSLATAKRYVQKARSTLREAFSDMKEPV